MTFRTYFCILHIILFQAPLANGIKKPNPLLPDGTNPSSRIVGGVEATPHEFPWMVQFRYSRIGQRCGGTILNANYVLTAAHCVDRLDGAIQTMHVLVSGEHSTRCKEGSEVYHRIVSVKIHEEFDRSILYHDIAIVQVDPPFQFNKYVQPIDPAPGDLIYPDQITIAGWGRHNVNISATNLRKVTVDRVGDVACAEDDVEVGVNATIQVCYGSGKYETTKSFCAGDSGGAGLCKMTNGRYVACGIISFVLRCGYTGAPMKFVRLTYYEGWIRLHSDIARPNFDEVHGCGGYFKGARADFSSFQILGGQHCHWIIETDFSVVTLTLTFVSLVNGDELYITDVNRVGLRYKPTIFESRLLHVFRDVSVIIVTLRTDKKLPTVERNIYFEFESSGLPAKPGPVTGFYNHTRNSSMVTYPVGTKYPFGDARYYYNSQNVMIVIVPEWPKSVSITFEFQWIQVPDPEANLPGPACRGDHIAFLYLNAAGEYGERVRHCGTSDVVPTPFDVGIDGLVIVNFVSGSDSQFGFGFRFRYFANDH